MNWRNIAEGWAGMVFGWLMHPSVWLLGTPLRFAALLAGCWAQESGGNEKAYNPERYGSLGMGQFQPDSWNNCAPSRWANASGLSSAGDSRRYPFRVGYVSVSYISAAVHESLWWLLAALPGLGLPLVRRMWVHGIGGMDVGPLKAIPEAITQANQEGQSWTYFLRVRAVTILPLLAWVLRYRKRGDKPL